MPMSAILLIITMAMLLHGHGIEDVFKKEALLKIFVYDLPVSLNKGILSEIKHTFAPDKCTDFSQEGMGSEIENYQNIQNISIRNTHQFSLEIILHHKLLDSRYRTLNPDEADIFYIPAYAGIKCMSNKAWFSEKYLDEYLKTLEIFLSNQSYFRQGKPHISSVGKIHREMAAPGCEYLFHPITKNITFLAIEKETSDYLSYFHFQQNAAQSLIVVPYPSYFHFTGEFTLSNEPEKVRDILILYPVGISHFPEIRAVLNEQFIYKTKLPYDTFINSNHTSDTNMVQIYTTDCSKDGVKTLVTWMKHSVFCLQPPGDSPTRKSFYDSILLGCIPVIFIDNEIPYAFPSFLDYYDISVVIKIKHFIESLENIADVLNNIDSDRIKQLQSRLNDVAKYMQYSIGVQNGPDALEMIMHELSKKFNLQ